VKQGSCEQNIFDIDITSNMLFEARDKNLYS